MLLHLCKLIWNKKKQNFLLMLEIFVSFMVLFAVFTLLINGYRNFEQSKGFDGEDAWVINVYPEGRASNYGDADSLGPYHESIRKMLRSFSDIRSSSFSGFNTPFAMGQNTSSVLYKNILVTTDVHMVDDDYARTLGISIVEGRWFDRHDDAVTTVPVVINQTLQKQLFGDEPALGGVIYWNKGSHDKLRVIGVAADMKDKGDYVLPGAAIFVRMNEKESATAATILIQVRPGTGARFEEKLQRDLSNVVKDARISIDHLSSQRASRNKFSLLPVIVLGVICGFLICNVCLGLFGILWYNINKRMPEIGLRRAIGATGGGISMQFMAEALILASLALTVGMFFTIQFPLLQIFDLPAGVYWASMAASGGFIGLSVFICSIIPGKQAAKVYPAVALHED